MGIPNCEALVQLQPRQTYTICVRALNVGGPSARSQPATVRTTGQCVVSILSEPQGGAQKPNDPEAQGTAWCGLQGPPKQNGRAGEAGQAFAFTLWLISAHHMDS